MDSPRLACLLLAVLAAIGVTAAWAGRWSDALDVAAHFAPFWLAIAAIALAAGLARGAPAACGVAAFAVLGASGLMAREVLEAAKVVAPARLGGERLTLLQFNLWAHNADPAATARWILDQSADVLTLEETGERGGEVVAGLASAYPHRIAGRTGDDTLILAREAPLASGPISDNGSPSGVWARFRDRRGAYTVVAVHLTWPIPSGAQRRQMDSLAARVEALADPAAILAGDFNSTPWSFGLHRQDARLRALGLARVSRALFTWPTPRFRRFGLPSPIPLLPIDHVYAGPDWRAVSVERGPALGSDHFPVVVRLELSAARGRSPRPT